MSRAPNGRLIEIFHDGTSRFSLVRRISTGSINKTCTECGNRRPRGHLFIYGTEPDDSPGRVNWHRGEFCSKRCHDNYH